MLRDANVVPDPTWTGLCQAVLLSGSSATIVVEQEIAIVINRRQ